MLQCGGSATSLDLTRNHYTPLVYRTRPSYDSDVGTGIGGGGLRNAHLHHLVRCCFALRRGQASTYLVPRYYLATSIAGRNSNCYLNQGH
jgi:hypothetical protein